MNWRYLCIGKMQIGLAVVTFLMGCYPAASVEVSVSLKHPEIIYIKKNRDGGRRVASDMPDVSGAKTMGMENRLIETLLANYSTYGRPIRDVNKPVEVTIAFYLTQLMALEEKDQVLTTFGWFLTSWKDEFLRWNSSDFEGLDRIVIPPNLVWLPDFAVENSAKEIYDELHVKYFRVAVSNTGLIDWVPGGQLVTSCQLDITYYPFDTQECNISIINWAYRGLQVKLTNGSHKIGLDAYTESGEWAILDTKCGSENVFYESEPGMPYPRVTFSLLLRRKPMFYTFNIITPCMIMSLLALLVFYLPPDSGEKVSLGITVLLAFSVFLLVVAENVPKTSESVPLIGIYLTLIMALTAISILITVIVLNLHHRDASNAVPRWLHRLVYSIMSNMVLMRRQCPNPQRASIHRMNRLTNNHAITAHAHEMQVTYDDDGELHDPCIDLRDTAKSKILLEEILRNLRKITDKLHEKEEQNSVKAEWKEVAKIVDRFFLVVYLLTVVVSTVVILYVYPMSSRRLHL